MKSCTPGALMQEETYLHWGCMMLATYQAGLSEKGPGKEGRWFFGNGSWTEAFKFVSGMWWGRAWKPDPEGWRASSHSPPASMGQPVLPGNFCLHPGAEYGTEREAVDLKCQRPLKQLGEGDNLGQSVGFWVWSRPHKGVDGDFQTHSVRGLPWTLSSPDWQRQGINLPPFW